MADEFSMGSNLVLAAREQLHSHQCVATACHQRMKNCFRSLTVRRLSRHHALLDSNARRQIRPEPPVNRRRPMKFPFENRNVRLADEPLAHGFLQAAARGLVLAENNHSGSLPIEPIYKADGLHSQTLAYCSRQTRPRAIFGRMHHEPARLVDDQQTVVVEEYPIRQIRRTHQRWHGRWQRVVGMGHAGIRSIFFPKDEAEKNCKNVTSVLPFWQSNEARAPSVAWAGPSDGQSNSGTAHTLRPLS